MDLDELLAQEAAVGRLDSQGQFTLDLEKMRIKLRQYQLAEPAFYVLKFVQAAVASGARQVEVRLQGGRVQARFEGAEAGNPLTLAAVLEALAMRATNRAARHLAVGMNAAMSVAERVEWSLHTPVHSRILRLTAQECEVLEAQPEPVTPGSTHAFTVTVYKPPRLLAWPASTASEKDAIRRRCAWSPVDVVLDGTPLRAGLPPPAPAPWHEGLSLPFYLMQHFDLGQGLRLLGPTLGPHAHREGGAWVGHPPRSAFLTEFSAFRPLDDQLLNCRGVFGLPLGLTGPSGVVIIMDGVALDQESVPGGPPGAVALLAADDLAVDLSEFKAVQDGRYLRRVDGVWERWNTMAARVLHSLPLLKGRLSQQFVERLVGGLGPVGRIVGPVLTFGGSLLSSGRDRNLRRQVAQRLGVPS